jgi:hypothetical protein
MEKFLCWVTALPCKQSVIPREGKSLRHSCWIGSVVPSGERTSRAFDPTSMPYAKYSNSFRASPEAWQTEHIKCRSAQDENSRPLADHRNQASLEEIGVPGFWSLLRSAAIATVVCSHPD